MKDSAFEIPLHMLSLLEGVPSFSGSGLKVDFVNYFNMQYEGPLFIGSQ
jgi:hypothetical protein